MKRRLFLGGCVACVVSRVAAQQPGQLPAPDIQTQYVQKTLAIGAFALATSRVAMDRAYDARTKQFARFEIAEQDTLSDILKSLRAGEEPARGLKAPSDMEMRQRLDPEAAAVLRRLLAAETTIALDASYLSEQVRTHRQLLQLQEQSLQVVQNASALHVAKMARLLTKEHLALLSDIHRELGLALEPSGDAAR